MITRASRKLAVAVLASGVFLGSNPAQAVGVTLDGDLSDLIAAVAANPGQSGSVSESGTDGESNGFDITEAYFHYDIPSDTFYIGFHTAGQLGTAGGGEGTSAFCNFAGGAISGIAGVFDGCENVGFQIDLGSDANLEFQFNVQGDANADSGLNTEQTPSITANPSGATFNWFVSESNDGVEFSVTGLAPPYFSLSSPLDITVLVRAGSGSNLGPEDFATIDTQLVPVPAAFWLFGSGLAGLAGIARRRR